jgi:hypothetical protein
MSSLLRQSISAGKSAAKARSFSCTASRSKFVPYDWKDGLRVETTLVTEDEQAIMCVQISKSIALADSMETRQTARDYCQSELEPRVTEAYRTESMLLLCATHPVTDQL